MSTPHHLDEDRSRGTRSIALNGWIITSAKRPILSIPEADAASDALDLALPEICFGNNALLVRHETSGFALEWNMLDMLKAVKKGEGWDAQPGSGAVRVAHADEWSRGQAASGSAARLKVQKPFDWTYTTLHRGTTSPASTSAVPAPAEWQTAPPSHSGIPLPLLARTDIPILFFDEIPLFEDELGDNGIADVTVRVRVNHFSFFILSRFSLRIDGVLFRHFDVRVFHRFGTDEIIREVKGREAPYDVVKARLVPSSASRNGSAASARSAPSPTPRAPSISIPSRTGFASPAASSPRSPFCSSPSPSLEPAEDLTPLTDINWVAGVLEELALAEDMQRGLRLGEAEARAENAKRWEGLGRRLEVLKVPWAAGSPVDP
ncbi:TIP41-like protein [Rhodotorula toruloides]|nr:TIP41-like protein [Rhodotorula toruloides]